MNGKLTDIPPFTEEERARGEAMGYSFTGTSVMIKANSGETMILGNIEPVPDGGCAVFTEDHLVAMGADLVQHHSQVHHRLVNCDEALAKALAERDAALAQVERLRAAMQAAIEAAR